ncbi:WecB/TagA/CpsF family glycosyltransferase [Lacticaseibacillus mingshuiensis]|uniref:WecB/TagA/CpsF family glycosyltransferase n=1 Tax=Lacticaseibacillus mingshuiensis TaxID=2799574 RepID=UPI001CECEBC4|nr:WecB/TagA/CpsF family glycosyltransferase [Lacticaseibacillus mingshuiensis]
MKKIEVLGVTFDAGTKQAVLAQIAGRLAARQGTFVVTANPEIVMKARRDSDFAALVKQADLVTADGIGVVQGAAMLGRPLPERVTGYDLLVDLLGLANEKHLRVFLIGAKPEVIAQTAAKVQATYPQLVLAGARDGYFDLTDTSVIDAVASARPDMVFAALGAPKQEQFLTQLRAQLPHALLMGVGGSFDVLAGVAKRAPGWMQRAHLEWLYRLIKQPSRLGRMMVLPQFVFAVRKQRRAERQAHK